LKIFFRQPNPRVWVFNGRPGGNLRVFLKISKNFLKGPAGGGLFLSHHAPEPIYLRLQVFFLKGVHALSPYMGYQSDDLG
jgi:hypothetical protein